MVALFDTPVPSAPVPLSELVLTDPYSGQALADERLHHLFEARCDWVTEYGPPGHLAVDTPELALTYGELDARANRLARHLRRYGIRMGDRVGLLLDRPADTCVAVLAVLKLGAACVPLDGVAAAVALEGARVWTVLTTGSVAGRLPDGVDVVDLDRAASVIDLQDARRFAGEERTADDRTAFVLHPAGPDGDPVAVAVEHHGLCAVVRGAADVSGLSTQDRVGVSIASGAAVEEMWATWACGATLVPAGAADRGITALWCDPKALAAVDDRPDLGVLLVDGPCPADLVARWYRPDRRVLDVFRPPGAVATALWSDRRPGRAPVLGVPLPAFSTVVMDVADPGRILPHGAVGEIGLAGVGLGAGFLDRPDLPGAAVVDPLGIPDNPSGLIHRTGVLGRVGPERQVEHHGRVGVRPAPTVLPVAPPAPSAPPADLPGDLTADLAAVLADVLGVEGDGHFAEDHFFDDLGADSMVMARFCARVRKRPDLPSPSIKDVYRNPTLRSLATALGGAAPAAPVVAVVEAAPVEPTAAPVVVPVETPRMSTAAYVLCGALQLLFFLSYSCLTALVTTTAFDWISAGTGFLDVYRRSVVAGGVSFAALCLLPILAKWVLIGRFKAGEIRIWSLGYVRFWVAKILIRANPLVLFVGSPLYVLYLRALGARVGRGAAVFSRSVPVCTDLLTIGDGAVVSQESLFSGYRARAGRIETGPVTIGRDAYVAEATVLDIGAVLGDGAQLGRSSSLQAGQVVPDGERWHGSPARPTHVDYRAVEPVRCGTLRRVAYSMAQLLTLLLFWLPLGFGGVSLLLVEVPRLNALLGSAPPALTTWAFYRDALIGGSVLFWGAVVVGLLLVTTVPRLLALAVAPDRTFHLYGIRWSLHRTVVRMTNVRFFTRIFGDSSYITGYLRSLGYDLGRVVQSGSNFGTEVRHEIPGLCSVGTGTMVADGLFMLNSSVSSTSFRVSRVSIGARNFLGNRIAYPADGRTGENCLLATKVMVPVDGPVRQGVGLLGSPCFEIPRTVDRDLQFEGLKSADELRRRLRAKNLHNIATMGLFLLTRWLYVVGLVLSAGVALDLYDRWGMWVVALDMAITPLFTVGWFVLVERAVTWRNPLRPLYCSIYEHDFWQRERYWKVPAEVYLQVFNGTPFKNVVMRLLGARVGRRVFDDGCYLTERSLCTIGDDCTLNVGSVVQCHSQEDGTFKSDRTAIDAGVTVGVGAFVHYGVTMGDASELAADSFLMKGEGVPAQAVWGGNPAVEVG